MSVLVTGGTGKLGRRTVVALAAMGAQGLAGTRSPGRDGQVRFDWSDPSSFGALDGVSALLAIAPPGASDPLATMRPGLDRALEAGVRRFVLAGASSIEMDGPLTGQVYRWLADHAPEWVVLRPSWFMQNFSEAQHLATIRDEGVIYSATGEGRVGFIDAQDIAAVAAVMLTAPEVTSREVLLTGPAALSYDAVASLISEATGMAVVHRRTDVETLTRRYEVLGLPPAFATALAAMDGAIAEGAEDRTTSAVRDITGREPTGFAAFAASAAPRWSAGLDEGKPGRTI